ncbi:electron transport complex protein RnfE [Novimethylophilus kurashikiensis]|uniref:Ion-translocating oxidoreductase complex subunit E n=1 Tax=Novimethylophilus kurashikiensis TaxID=1825523 RepID=A0A2R5F7U8_9PROT|nr:electron transport complex subunit E [Novimethylophilus kurashikiensis]GBG14115.1 electron transport complex protein RnfE [Novimethylophilus kurashikiensis]
MSQGTNQYQEIVQNGLWRQNPGVVQLLGLCPTLAVTTSVVNGFSLGLLTALVMAASNASVSPVRRWVPSEIRIPVFILIIAALVTVGDLAMHAYLHALHLVLGIFIPLIVTNCIVLARVEAFAAKNNTAPSALDGLMMGLGLALVLAILGGIREVIGKGTLFSGIDLALGPAAKQFVITVVPHYQGFLLAVLPPGAFMGLALLVATRNWLEQRRQAKAGNASSAPVDTAMAHGH